MVRRAKEEAQVAKEAANKTKQQVEAIEATRKRAEEENLEVKAKYENKVEKLRTSLKKSEAKVATEKKRRLRPRMSSRIR